MLRKIKQWIKPLWYLLARTELLIFLCFILEEDWFNIRIINKLHLLKQHMLEAYHMEKQIFLDKPLKVTWERQTSLQGLGGGIKAFINPVFSRANSLSGIKVRESSPFGRSPPTDHTHSLTEKHTAPFSWDNRSWRNLCPLAPEKQLHPTSEDRNCHSSSFQFLLSSPSVY